MHKCINNNPRKMAVLLRERRHKGGFEGKVAGKRWREEEDGESSSTLLQLKHLHSEFNKGISNWLCIQSELSEEQNLELVRLLFSYKSNISYLDCWWKAQLLAVDRHPSWVLGTNKCMKSLDSFLLIQDLNICPHGNLGEVLVLIIFNDKYVNQKLWSV